MKFFKKLLLAELLLSLMSGYAMAAEDVTVRALKLYEKHHYEEAARLLRPELSGMDDAHKSAASLALGMIYLGSAMLYRDLYHSALAIELDYLGQLSKQKTGTPSRYVYLYLGQVLLEAGKPADAALYLGKFAAQKAVLQTSRTMGSIELGIAYSRQKQAQKANNLWAATDKSKPEIKAALAGAFSITGSREPNPVLLADAALSDAKSQRYTPSARMIRNILRAYSYGGASDKALDLLKTNELDEASYMEDLGESKSISFYDSSLLDDLARIHLKAAVSYLDQAYQDQKLSSFAAYYLADAYLQLGDAASSLRHAASLLSQAKLPQQYRNRALVNQASAYSISGRRSEAQATWLSMAEKSHEDPALLTTVILACALAGGDCTQLEKHALAALEKGEGKKFFPLNAALGKYYLMQKNYSKAMLYMEAGRDKANKNKIEANDPLLLVGLAEAYYRNKKFSENLEIYFELGKHYPAVRQIQDAMQGIYAMEQQSAGDVKIF